MRAVAAARGALARAAARRPGAPPVAGRQGAQAGGASAYAPVTQAGRLLLARGADEPGRPPEETRSGLRGWPPAAPASRGPGSRAPGPGRTSSATGTCPEPEPRVIWAEHLLREQLVGCHRGWRQSGVATDPLPLHPGLAGSRLVLAPRCGTARLRSRRWPPAVRARPRPPIAPVFDEAPRAQRVQRPPWVHPPLPSAPIASARLRGGSVARGSARGGRGGRGAACRATARQLILCRALGAARTLARGRRALDAPCRRPSLRVTLAGVRAPLGLVTALSHLT
ncbi:unnamed protein product [Prorocentrum cordatum]|uniref:Translation initiation factor IF-2-like n=1 Tax=Prorocentrum cordatum TaxID=2364126 RepID=A0ABN9XKB3_9DINO|nr:unnamed protein product [Polarella glacialis]